MVQIDDFESQFRRAAKAIFDYELPEIRNVVLAFDGELPEREQYVQPLKDFLSGTFHNQSFPADQVSWEILSFEPAQNVSQLVQQANQTNPDLIITRRHLFKEPEGPLESLGIYVDVLAQSASAPVLLVPRLGPEELGRRLRNTSDVMVLSDSLSEDSHLVNFGALFTEPDGCLYLADVEDGAAFERYIQIIEKIPLIDSELAREEIDQQLQKEVREFCEQCAQKICTQRSNITVEWIFRYGSSIVDFRQLLTDYKIDLLIFNTKDASQMAMHGLAYPLAVEFTGFPLLML